MNPFTDFMFTVTPRVGGFTPTTYHDLLQCPVTFPGLDPQYQHTLIDVTVRPDGSAAQLTVRSEPHHRLSLDNELRPVDGTPPARVQAFDAAGTLLHTGAHAAPLHPGQPVTIGAVAYRVAAVSWPNRDPATGACTGTVDWQHAVLMPDPPPAAVPVAAPDDGGPVAPPAVKVREGWTTT